ncbi:MAG TPA: hypothetical protein VKQ30_06615 [Ktedonobacterales bacterium]|nr:hypothetical protein [Ktedonobacterales bacterium]
MLLSRRSRSALVTALVGALLLCASFSTATAASYYPSGSGGFDISTLAPRSPKKTAGCSTAYPPASYSFGIVGVTGGRAFTENACLGSDYQWAARASTAPTAAPSLYMNVNAPIGSTASQGATGPDGTCASSNKTCLAYNYGWNAAQYAFSIAAQQGAASTMWWLDVETANSWWPSSAMSTLTVNGVTLNLNAVVIKGAADFASSQGLTVGVYSTASQWTTIAGSYNPRLPNWVAGTATCSAATPFYAGASVWLVQYSVQYAGVNYDADTAC